MADVKKYWLGSVGPLYYDADEEPGGLTGYDQAAVISEGTIVAMEAPVEDEEVLRLVDVGDIVGDVFGPGSSTDNAAVRFDGITGKYLQNSGVIIDDSNNVKVPSITANRLVRTDASQQLNEADLIDFTAGGDGINVVAAAGGAVIISTTAGASGVTGAITVYTDFQWDSTTLQYKTRTLTLTDGYITAIGAESAWTDVPTA